MPSNIVPREYSRNYDRATALATATIDNTVGRIGDALTPWAHGDVVVDMRSVRATVIEEARAAVAKHDDELQQDVREGRQP